jgi:hypothetical protein
MKEIESHFCCHVMAGYKSISTHEPDEAPGTVFFIWTAKKVQSRP